MPPFSGTVYFSLNMVLDKKDDLGETLDMFESDIPNIMPQDLKRCSGDKERKTSEEYRYKWKAANGCQSYENGIVGCGRRQSEDKRQKIRRDSNGGGNDGKTSGRSSKGFENNSSSSGGNSGADGNGEDNDHSDDDYSYDYEEEDDDYEEEEEEEEEEEYDQDDDDDDNNVVEIKKSKQRNVKQEREKESSAERRCQISSVLSNTALMTGSAVEGTQPSLESPQSSTEHSLAPAQPGTPVVLQGFICHETVGGVLVVNIQWRNRNYCGSLIDSSRHAWATPRFEESGCTGDTGSSPHKGGKGKKLRDNSLSSPGAGHSKGSNSVHATPHKHKLRGRKRCHVNSNSKSPGLRGKKKLRNHDDESDDGVRPGKRSCTLKSRGVSPQPSPTLIECPEPNCNKKYKHINGLRYHQAHAHLEPRSPQEETNPSDQSASASPSPIEEFKEPETKSTGRWKSSTRSGVRSRSVSPFTPLSTSSSSVSERNTSSIQAGKTNKGSLDNSGSKAIKNRKSPCTTTDEQKEMSARLEGTETPNSRIDKAVKVEESRTKEEQNAKENKEHRVVCKEEPNDVGEAESQIKLKLKAEASVEEVSSNKLVDSQAESGDATQVVDISCVKKEEVDIKTEKTVETEEVVWETVIDSGRGIQGGPDGVNIEDAIDVGQEENIISIRKGASLLGIEVEDISENEEEIDPGKDDSYPNKDAFVPIERQRELHFRSFASDHPGSTGVQDRTRPYEFDSSNSLKPIGSNERQREEYMNFNICANQYSSEVKIIKPKGQRAKITQPSLVTNSEQTDPLNKKQTDHKHEIDQPLLEIDASSIESLVAKSMSRSAVEPPLTNADSPADRYKSYKYRSFGDKSCPPDLCEQSGKSDCITTLAPVRQLDTVSHCQTSQVTNSSWKDVVGSNSSDNTSKADPCGVNRSDRTLQSTRSPSQKLVTTNDLYSSTVSLSSSSHSSDNTSNYLTVVASTQHRMSPKMSTKVLDSESTARGENIAIRSSLSPHRRSPFQKSFTSEHSAKTAYKQQGDGTSFVEKETSHTLDSKRENQTSSGTAKTKDNIYSKATERFIPDIQLTPDTVDTDLDNSTVAVQEETMSKEDDSLHALKSSSQLFSRQLPTLPRHSRLTVPQLPIGVARPYHHGGMELEVAGTSNQERPVYSLASAGEGSTGEIDKAKLLKKPEDKNQEVLVGEALSVGTRRSMPAIHAGLPSVVLATAHALNTRSSPGLSAVHTAHKASKPSNEEDQATLEAKGESFGRDTLTYSGRPVIGDVKEQHDKKQFQMDVAEGSSSTGTIKGKSSRAAATDFDGSVRKNEGGSWMNRNERACEPPHSIEPDAQQVERLSAEQLQRIYHQLTQVNQLIGSAYFNPEIQMPQECHVRQEIDKERAVGKSQESKEAIQVDIESNDKHKSTRSKEVNQLGSPSSTKASKAVADGLKKVQPDSYLVGSNPKQAGLLSAQAAAQQSGDGAVKNLSRISFDEPLEKKTKVEYQRNDKSLESELERQKYRMQEEMLQKESMQQKLSMFRQLESNFHQTQLLPKKHHIGGPEMKDSQLAEIDEDLADVKAVRKEGILVSPQRDKPIKYLGSTSKHHYGSSPQDSPDSQTKYDSQSQKRVKPYDSHQRPTSLNLSSSRMSLSPGIVPNKDVLEQVEARGGERSASAPVPSNFDHTRIRAYLQQFPAIAFDPSSPYYQQPFMPGFLMGMPVMCTGSTTEISSSSTSSLTRVNQEEATNPRRTSVGNQLLPPVTSSRSRSPRPVNTRGSSPGLEKRHYHYQDNREHSPRPLGTKGPSPGPDDAHHSNQDTSSFSRGRSPRASSSRGTSPNPEGHRHGNSAMSRERSPRMKGEYREKDHATLLAMPESRYSSNNPQSTRHYTDSHEGALAKSLPSADHHLYRSGVISNNLVVRRGEIQKASSIPSSQLEEEMLRKQRTGADYGDPAKHSLGYQVRPALLESSPYSAGIPPTTTRHGGSDMGRYHNSRK